MKLRKLKNPLVSIVMTIYNEAHCVAEAIDTLLAQSYKHFELVLVNNGSRDKTLEVLNRYRDDARVKIVSLKKNLGPGGGRNAGVKVAAGEIVVFIDAYMVFDKTSIRGLIKPILDGEVVGTTHDTELVKNKQNVWARSLCVNRIVGKPLWSGVFRAVLRKKFLAAGGFDPSKGYFDDEIRGIGKAKVVHAVCYHNNPETLSETFKHSAWVGRSLMNNKSTMSGAMRNYWVLLAAVVLVLGGGIVLVLAYNVQVLPLLLALFVLAWVLVAAKLALSRAVNEKRLEYLVTIPVLWAVRMLGYVWGMLQMMAELRK